MKRKKLINEKKFFIHKNQINLIKLNEEKKKNEFIADVMTDGTQ